MARSQVTYHVKCPVCCKEFDTVYVKAKYCSTKCRIAASMRAAKEKRELLSEKIGRRKFVNPFEDKTDADKVPPRSMLVREYQTTLASEAALTENERDVVLRVHVSIKPSDRWPYVKSWNVRMKHFLYDLYRKQYIVTE